MALPAGSNQIRDPEGQNRVVTKCFVKKEKKMSKEGFICYQSESNTKAFWNYFRRISA